MILEIVHILPKKLRIKIGAQVHMYAFSCTCQVRSHYHMDKLMNIFKNNEQHFWQYLLTKTENTKHFQSFLGFYLSVMVIPLSLCGHTQPLHLKLELLCYQFKGRELWRV